MSQNSFFYKYKSIVAFLILEMLALVSFTFANINEILYIISSLLSVAAFTFAFVTNVNKKEMTKVVPVLVLLFVISGIAAFGGFARSFSKLSNIATFFAIPGFFALGFFLRRIGEVKLENVLLAIGFGLALITLIGTVATWVEYGFFYSIIYKIKGTTIYYYNGVMYDVTKEMTWLLGFKFSEISQAYGGLFAVLCGCFLPTLFFIDRKANKNLFLSVAVIGCVGLISILTIANLKALIVVVLASLFAFGYKFLKKKKNVLKGIAITTTALLGIALLGYFITIINAAAGFKLSGGLARLFVNNGIMQYPTKVLEGAFAKTTSGNLYNLFGFDLTNPSSVLVNLQGICLQNTNIFEYEIIKEVGVIGTIFVVILLIGMYLLVVRYLVKSKDSAFIKNLVVIFLLGFLIYSTISCDVLPQTHNQNYYNAFLRSVPFMLSLFMFGLTYFPSDKVEFNLVKEEKKEEAK